jgi:hypothetical protein
MSLLNEISSIGTDILLGVEAAAPILETFVPAAGPILQDIAAVIMAIEQAGGEPVKPEILSQVVQSAAMTSAIKQLPRKS